MKICVIILFFELSYAQLSNRTTTENNFVEETALYSTPHTTVSDVNTAIKCAMLCGRNPECCGFTQETSTFSCLLFDYQTSNNCQNITDGSVELQYVKHQSDCSQLPPDQHSGVHRVYPSRQTGVLVYCEMTDAGGGWTVLQRRHNGSEDFYRFWTDYKNGFGDFENEFWLGNDIIHIITPQKQYKVRFDLEDFDGLTAFAEYQSFYVDNEAMNYGLNISGYSGTAGSPEELDFATNGIVPFSTRDVDNDKWSSTLTCCDDRQGAWWFTDCGLSNINGMYQPAVSWATARFWWPWRGGDSLAKTRMMIKPAL